MIRIFAFGILLGVVLLHQLSVLPSAWWLLVPATTISLALLRLNRLTLLLAAIALGFGWAYVQSNWQLQDPVPPSLYGKDIRVRGYIASLPELQAGKQRFELDVVEVLQPANAFAPQKIRVSWYDSSAQQLHAGQEWLLTVRIKPARNFANPGMFNYTAWLFQKGIRYTGYVRTQAGMQLLSHSVYSYPIQQFRERIRSIFKQHLAKFQFEPLMRALVIGDRSDITQQTWSVLQKTGTVHLMAISGLHIGLIAGFIFIVFRFLWSRSPVLCLKLAAPRAAAVFAIISALLYAALAGFSLPTQRALIMLSVVMLALVLQRKTSALDTLSVALILVLVYDTHAILSVSFWLSFSAVALILVISQLSYLRANFFHNWIYMQFAISLGLLPLTVLFFQQAPLISPLANLIAIPVIAFIVVPALMLGLVLFVVNTASSIMLFSVIAKIIDTLWLVLTWLANLPFSGLIFSTPTLFEFALACLGIMLLLLPAQFRLQYLSVALFIPLLFQSYERPTTGEAYVTILDVGQGLATVVQTRQHTLVFDTGPRFSEQFDTGSAVVVPYLREQGVTQIDKLVVSHGDNDHAGGTRSILSLLPVQEVVTSIPNIFSRHSPVRCQAGMHWSWDEVDIHVLHPAAEDFNQGLSENNLSCVLQITTRSRTYLLTGDIEAQVEQMLVARYGDRLQSQVLLVPHHGSKTSSSGDFIAHVRPTIAVIPVGWRNRYRFPHKDVISRYQLGGVKMYSTAESGAIRIDSLSGEVSTFREQSLRFWE